MRNLIITVAIVLTSLMGIAQADSTQQCIGIKANKEQCMMQVEKPIVYCHHHDPSKLTCAGTNSRKLPCKMIVTEAGSFCKFHKH